MIAELLRRLQIGRGTCVEVGAHDGFTFSNTARLWHEEGWRAVLIEPHPARYRQLVQRTVGFDCTTLQRAVGATEPDRLSTMLSAVGVEHEIDLLSIDVDGDDLEIVRDLHAVRAKILVVEYNPTIPWDVRAEGTSGTPTGCSLSSLLDVAEERGYRLAGVTRTNGIFIRADDAAVLADIETEPAVIADRSSYTYIVTDYRGRSAVVGSLPFRHRPGRPAFREQAIARSDVQVRWTASGALDAARWKAGNVVRQLRGMSARELRELAVRRVRR